MSSGKGLNDYINSISSFGSNVDGVQNWIQANDNEFFQDWRDKTNKAIAEATKKGQAAIHVGEEIGGAYAGFKAVKAAYNKYYPSKKGSDKPGDDEAEDQEGDGDEADQAANNDAAAPDEADTAADSAEGTPLDATQEGVGESTGTFTADETNLPEPGAEIELQDASNFGQQAEQGASLTETINQPASVGTQAQQSIMDADPEAADFNPGLGEGALDAAGEGAESAGAAAADVGGGAAADAAAAGAGAAADAAAAGGTAAATAATEAGGTALAAGLGVAAEAIPVVGALAAIGVGLYELFHHHAEKKPPAPAPPPSITATKSSFVLPSFDSVVDTPASTAAF